MSFFFKFDPTFTSYNSGLKNYSNKFNFQKALDVSFPIGVCQMLTIADGGVVHTEGGRGVQESLILADVICEQPLTRTK